MGVGRKPTGPTIPVGDSGQRPADPAVGSLRYNTDIDTLEFWNGLIFSPVGTQGEVDITVDTFTANGTQATWTMSRPVNFPTQVMVFIGGVYQAPDVDYTVSGNDIMFTNPVPVDNFINIIHKIGSTVVNDGVEQYVPPANPGISGGVYNPSIFDPTPDDPVDGGTYNPVDTSPAGDSFDGGTYA